MHDAVLTPSRQRGFEFLDDPAIVPGAAARSLADVALANRLFGGERAVLREVTAIVHEACARNETTLSLLDVGTGLGDIPEAATGLGRALGVTIRTIGLEKSQALAALSLRRVRHNVAADARSLPFADKSVDVITCSQLLHHFGDTEARQVLAECSRVASRAVIVSDLRRSWVAIGLLWLVSFPLRFHPMSRHDGVASIRRGYTTRELDQLIVEALGVHPVVRRQLGWRVTARWKPGRKES